MSFEVGLSSLVTPTSDTTLDFTSSELSAAPKCVWGIINESAVQGTANDAYRVSMGSTDGTRESGAVNSAAHGGATASVTRRQLDTETLLLRPGEGANAIKLAHNAFLSNGWQSNVTLTGGAVGKFALAMMFGGSDLIRCESGVVGVTNAVDTEQTINFNDSSLKPNVIIFYTCGTTAAAGMTSFFSGSFGIGIKPGSTITQHCINNRVDVDGATEGNPAQQLHTDRVQANFLTNDTIQWELELTDISTGSMGLTPRVASPGGDEINFLAMEIDNVNIALLTKGMPTSTGVHSFTGFGFQPSFMLGAATMLTAVDTIAVNDSAGASSVCSFNANEKFAFSWANEDASATIDNQSLSHDRAVHYAFDDGTIGTGAAAGNGFDSGTNTPTFTNDGFDLDFDVVNNTERQSFWLAIGPTLSGTTNITITPSGDLKGTGALSGTTNITLTATGDIGGIGGMSGTTNIDITVTGNLSGTAALSGTTNIIFIVSGDAMAMVAASGTINITILPTGDLTGTGALKGTTNITIAVTGDLTASALFNQLSGTTTITLTLAGSIVDNDVVKGRIIIQIVVSALKPDGSGGTKKTKLTGGGILKGTINISITLEGYLVQEVPIVDCDVETMYPIQPIVKSNQSTFRKDSMEWVNVRKSKLIWRSEIISLRFRMQDIKMKQFADFHTLHKAEIVKLVTPGMQPFIRPATTNDVRIIKVGAPKKSMPRMYDMSITYRNELIEKVTPPT